MGQWSRPALPLILGVLPKFTHGDHQGFLEQATIGKICDQSRERLVGRRSQIILEPAEHIFVRVPVGCLSVMLTVVNRDETNAGLDQTPGQEDTLPELIPAVTVSELRVFQAQVKRLPYGRRVQEPKGLLGVNIAWIEASPCPVRRRCAVTCSEVLPAFDRSFDLAQAAVSAGGRAGSGAMRDGRVDRAINRRVARAHPFENQERWDRR